LSSFLREAVGRDCLGFSRPGKVIRGKGLRLDGLVEMSQDITISHQAFIWIYAFDECKPEYRECWTDVFGFFTRVGRRV